MGTEGTLNRLPESAQWIWIVRRLFFTVLVRMTARDNEVLFRGRVVSQQYEVFIANIKHSPLVHTVRCQ